MTTTHTHITSQTGTSQRHSEIAWKHRFLAVCLVLALSLGFWVVGSFSGLLSTTSSPAAALYGALQGKAIKGKKLCANVASDDFHGAFRELDCLITFRRTFPKKGRSLNNLILQKFRGLHKRLQRESTDWRTVARWKLLYLLGTRMYPVQNKWAENAAIPVYEFNGHHMAVPFWIKEHVKGRKLGTLFHFDTHNDMRAVPSPKQVLQAVANLKKNVKVKDAWHTISHSIYDCAMPVAGGVLTAGYRNVVWGKPSWNGYPEFVNHNFFFGRPKSGVPVNVLPANLKGEAKKKALKRSKSNEKKRSHFRMYYDIMMNQKRNKIPAQDAWVMVAPKQRPSREKFEMFTPFKLTILTTDEKVETNGSGPGSAMFKKLLKALPKGRFTLDLDLDYFASVDSTDSFKRKAGSDPEWQLDLLSKRRKFLNKNLEKFRKLLTALRNRGRVPSLITIADSTYLTFAFDAIAEGQSEYTPIEHTAFIRKRVREIFRTVYGKQVIGSEATHTSKAKAAKPPTPKDSKRAAARAPKKPSKQTKKQPTPSPKARHNTPPRFRKSSP